MIGFWILAALAAVVTIAILARSMWVGGQDATAATARYDMQIYRDQLRELERDTARGVIGAAEAERARVEISRRLLEADRKAQSGETDARAPRAVTLSAIALTAALLAGGGYRIYTGLGAPGYWDMPLQGRFDAADQARTMRTPQAEIEAGLPAWPGPPEGTDPEYLELIENLREAVAANPEDLRGQELLATHEFALGNFVAAHRAVATLIELKGDAATSADYSRHADLLVLAARGYVSPEAERAVVRALTLDARNQVAQYYAGLTYLQTGRPDLAFQIWRSLLETSAPDAPWVAPIRERLPQLALSAGVDYTLPPLPEAAPAGPTAQDIANDASLTPDQRRERLGEMADRLMLELNTQGGTAPQWAELLTVLALQGETERARSIWGEAQSVFAAAARDRALIDDTAKAAGLGEPLPFDDTEILPPPSEAPTEADHGAAIRQTVTTLLDKLANTGGTAPEWAQLIAGLMVLGDADYARTIWDEARNVFANHPESLAMVDEAAANAGLSRGPTAQDRATAAEMSDADQAAMIEGMVAGLYDTLTTEGGAPARWQQLFSALAVLGDTARAQSAWTAAQTAFADAPDTLDTLRPAATAAGAVE